MLFAGQSTISKLNQHRTRKGLNACWSAACCYHLLKSTSDNQNLSQLLIHKLLACLEKGKSLSIVNEKADCIHLGLVWSCRSHKKKQARVRLNNLTHLQNPWAPQPM